MQGEVDMEMIVLARNWGAIAVRGVVAILFGLLTLVVPGLTLTALVLLFGAYALVDGIFSIVAAIRRRPGDPPGWALLLEGIVGIAAGLVTFLLPGLTAVTLVYVIAAWAIVTGVLELVAAFRLRRQVTGEWRLVLSGVLSIVFGVLVMMAPRAGALAMTLWIGAYAIVFGALLLALAFRLRRLQAELRDVPLARAA
jgi:uncharacterized membrane protein HdeD (DUF308 family)